MEVEAIVEVGVDAPGEALFTEIGFPRLNISIIKINYTQGSYSIQYFM